MSKTRRNQAVSNPVESAAILNEEISEFASDSVSVHNYGFMTRPTFLPNDVNALFNRLGFKGPRRRA